MANTRKKRKTIKGGGKKNNPKPKITKAKEKTKKSKVADGGIKKLAKTWAGKEIEKQGFPALETAVDQHAEIAEFLGNFMQGDGNGRDQADLQAHDERGGDGQAVNQVVDAVADQDEIGDRAFPVDLVRLVLFVFIVIFVQMMVMVPIEEVCSILLFTV